MLEGNCFLDQVLFFSYTNPNLFKQMEPDSVPTNLPCENVNNQRAENHTYM